MDFFYCLSIMLIHITLKGLSNTIIAVLEKDNFDQEYPVSYFKSVLDA